MNPIAFGNVQLGKRPSYKANSFREPLIDLRPPRASNAKEECTLEPQSTLTRFPGKRSWVEFEQRLLCFLHIRVTTRAYTRCVRTGLQSPLPHMQRPWQPRVLRGVEPPRDLFWREEKLLLIIRWSPQIDFQSTRAWNGAMPACLAVKASLG